MSKVARLKPYTVAELSDKVDSHDIKLAEVADLLVVVNKIWKFLRTATPFLIGALVASGVVTGPLGKALSYIAANWPS